MWLLSSFLTAGILAGCTPPDPLKEARESQEAGRFAESMKTLEELISQGREEPELLYLYGHALRVTGSPQRSIWSLRKAAEDPVWELQASLELAIAALQTRAFETARAAADRVLNLEADHKQALAIRAESLSSGLIDPEAALADFDRLLEMDPENFRVRVLKAEALLRLQRIDEAAEVMSVLEERGKSANLGSAGLGTLCVTNATFASEKGDVEDAESLFVDCLERFPDSGVVFAETIRFFEKVGQVERVFSILEDLLERSPASIQFRIALANRLRQRGEIEAAEKVLRAGLEVPDERRVSDAYAALADHFLMIGDESLAADFYIQAFESFPDPTPYQILTLADLFARAGRNERALEIAQQIEDMAQRGLIEARVFLNENQPEKALSILDEVLPSWPDNPGARYYAARAAEQIGDFERAIEEYRQAIRSGPAFTDAGLRLARIHEAQGELERAWAVAAQYYEARQQDVAILPLLFQIAHRLNNPARLGPLLERLSSSHGWAIALAERSNDFAERFGSERGIDLIERSKRVELSDPSSAPALRSLVRHLVASNRSEQAENALAEALSKHPDSADFHEIRGMLHEAVGAGEAATEAYQRALEIDPQHARSLAALGALVAAGGQTESALALLDRANSANPDDPQPLRLAGSIEAGIGHSEEAIEHWGALLREHPQDAATLMLLAKLRLESGQATDNAVELARRALRFGGGEEARALLVELHTARGESQLAEESRALPVAENPRIP